MMMYDSMAEEDYEFQPQQLERLELYFSCKNLKSKKSTDRFIFELHYTEDKNQWNLITQESADIDPILQNEILKPINVTYLFEIQQAFKINIIIVGDNGKSDFFGSVMFDLSDLLAKRQNPMTYFIRTNDNLNQDPNMINENTTILLVEYSYVPVDPYEGTPWEDDKIHESKLIENFRSSNTTKLANVVNTSLVCIDDNRISIAVIPDCELPEDETILYEGNFFKKDTIMNEWDSLGRNTEEKRLTIKTKDSIDQNNLVMFDSLSGSTNRNSLSIGKKT